MPKKKIDYDKMARTWIATGGKNMGEVLRSGGFTNATAKRGRASISKKTKAALGKAINKLMEKNFEDARALSEKFDTEGFRDIVRGSLIKNIGERTDQGIQSIKVAANLSELDMMRPEVNSGVIIIKAAPIPSFDAIPGVELPPEPTQGLLNRGSAGEGKW